MRPLVVLCGLGLLPAAAAQAPHWAFVAPARPTPPAGAAGAQPDPIDRFVHERRQAQGLTAAPPASRGELLRRVTFDLTGLPPTLAALDAFERDDAPDAYERVVDRLLATTAAAEEATRLWLDLSRYADTHGMQRDQVRALWRWRDWVIDAYAANVPFDRFVTDQLAGDLLPGASDAQRIASGWNRNNPTSDEGGLIPEEYLARYAMNRTDTFGTALLGLTVGCAQCHDHKSDPLSQRDYYRLLGYFASFDEAGNDGGALAPAPAIVAPRPEEAAELQRLRAAATELREAYDASWRPVPWAQVDLGAPHTVVDDGSLLVGGTAPANGDYELHAVGDFAGVRALRLVALPDDTLPARGPGRADNGNFVLGECEVRAGSATAVTPVPIATAEVSAEHAQDGHPGAAAFDTDPATGWAIAGRHQPTLLHVPFATPLPAGTERLVLRLRHGTAHARHLLGRFVVHASCTATASAAAQWLAAERAATEFAERLPQCMVSGERVEPRPVHVLRRGRYDQPGEQVRPGTPAFLPPLPAEAPADRRALAAWLFTAGQPLVARVAVNRIWARHFGRGLVATPHDFGVLGARPSHPELLDWLACEFRDGGWDERALHRRLVRTATYRQSSRVGEAARATDPDNVWLARMPRTRLPAEAIRDQALAAGGILVERSHGPSVKIPQPPGIWEAVAFPGSNTEHYVADTGDAIRRRSLYTFWKRSAPPPLLTSLDAPSRELCVVERQVTNTPLQVLALWNDETMVAAAAAFAQRCAAAPGGDSERVAFAFRTLLQRRPEPAELAACLVLLADARRLLAPDAAAYAEAGVWNVLTGMLLSHDDALHRG
jgi:hypothetical protein